MLSNASAVAARPIANTPKLVAAIAPANSALLLPMRGAAKIATAWHHTAAAITDGSRNANSVTPNASTESAWNQ